MICKYCNKEIPDGSKYCPFCGAYLEEASNASVNQIKEGSGGHAPSVSQAPKDEITPENFRSLPTYKPRLIKMVVFGAIAFVFTLIAMLGSLMVRFIGGGSLEVPGIIMLAFGLASGVTFLVLALSLNKKVFPQVNAIKMKGIEILVPIFIAFSLCFAIVSLVLQGIVFVIY